MGDRFLRISIYTAASFSLIFAVYSSAVSANARRSPDACKAALSHKKGAVQLPDIKPIALRARDKPFDDSRYQFELKYDGYRGVAYFERDRGCRIISRSGKKLTQFQPLCDAIAAELNVENAIFDGEVIAHDLSGRPIFTNIRRRKGPFQYVAFDLLWLNNHDLRHLSLEDRRHLLLEVLPKRSSLITESLAETGNGIKMFQLMVDNDLEGIVAKRLADKYLRTTKWYKIKNKSYSQAVGRGRFFR
jgi:bifunctional non-homologous end joining protein LigD